MISHKRAREIPSLATAHGEPAGASELDGAVVLSANATVHGRGGALGFLSRVWVDRSSSHIAHVLFRSRMPLSRSGREHILPAELIESIGRVGVAVTIDPAAIAELPVFRADTLIAGDVHQALDGVLTSPRARRGVKVRVDDGHVTLAGEVDTVEQAQLAERAAARVAGIRALRVDLAAQEALAAAVEERIASLVTSASNGHGPVRALAEHGIVYLEGSVTSEQAREEMERIALGVAGARVIVNNVHVNGVLPLRGLGTGPLVRNR
jgi:osmotically-inducible protein OsmY